MKSAKEVPLLVPVHRHLKHHARFYAALAVGIGTWLATGLLDDSMRLAAAGDAFYGVYLAATADAAIHANADALRRHATYEDEGIVLIIVITLGAIALSLWSIFSLINAEGRPGLLPLMLAIASVPLGWLTLHTIAAFHYAHLYYARVKLEGKLSDAGGLVFPGTHEPTAWDFLYYSFVVGMTAQVSDVQIVTTAMRRLTMAHGIVSYFYSTVLLALAVNLIVTQAR
jgi:uncharacterized membrane protein